MTRLNLKKPEIIYLIYLVDREVTEHSKRKGQKDLNYFTAVEVLDKLRKAK